MIFISVHDYALTPYFEKADSAKRLEATRLHGQYISKPNGVASSASNNHKIGLKQSNPSGVSRQRQQQQQQSTFPQLLAAFTAGSQPHKLRTEHPSAEMTISQAVGGKTNQKLAHLRQKIHGTWQPQSGVLYKSNENIPQGALIREEILPRPPVSLPVSQPTSMYQKDTTSDDIEKLLRETDTFVAQSSQYM